jgi:hypothetical protein
MAEIAGARQHPHWLLSSLIAMTGTRRQATSSRQSAAAQHASPLSSPSPSSTPESPSTHLRDVCPRMLQDEDVVLCEAHDLLIGKGVHKGLAGVVAGEQVLASLWVGWSMGRGQSGCQGW